MYSVKTTSKFIFQLINMSWDVNSVIIFIFRTNIMHLLKKKKKIRPYNVCCRRLDREEKYMFICRCDRIPLFINYPAGLPIMSYWTCCWSVPPPGMAISCCITFCGSIKSTEVLLFIKFQSLVKHKKVQKGQFNHPQENPRVFRGLALTVSFLQQSGGS